MHRSYLPSIDFKIYSLTDWAVQLKTHPLFATLSRFELGDAPDVGTFYDFLIRLQILSFPIFLPIYILLKRKGAKADLVNKVSVDQLLRQLESTSFVLDKQPYASLFKIYHREFLSQSLAKGLILLIFRIFPSPVTGHLLSLLQGSRSILPVTVRKKKSRVVPVTISFSNLTAILDGIFPETAFISTTTYTCLLPLTQKVTSLFFLC